MRTASLMLALLVAAALAGCTGGTSSEGQPPTDATTDTGTVSGSASGSPTRAPGSSARDVKDYEPYLEASVANGTAPLNVTLTFGVTWMDNGRRTGQTGSNANGSADPRSAGRNNGTHEGNGGHDGFDWTLQVLVNATAGNGTTNGSPNSTGSTGSSTGSSTGTTGNATGNSTGNATGNATAPNSAVARANGTVVASFNGTGGELPSNRTVTLDAAGSYDAVFTVRFDNGTTDKVVRTITTEPLPPGSPLGNETRTFEGSFLASEPLLCFGSEEFEWVLNGTFSGRLAEVSHVNVTVEASGFADVELTLAAPNGTEVASGPEIHAEGPWAAGNYTLTAESCFAAEAEFTVTAIAHYVSRAD